MFEVAVPAKLGLEKDALVEKVKVEVQQVQLFRLLRQGGLADLLKLRFHASQKCHELSILVLLRTDFFVEQLQPAF